MLGHDCALWRLPLAAAWGGLVSNLYYAAADQAWRNLQPFLHFLFVFHYFLSFFTRAGVTDDARKFNHPIDNPYLYPPEHLFANRQNDIYTTNNQKSQTGPSKPPERLSRLVTNEQ